MAEFKDLDLEPRARLTFAIFLIAEPSALVEGLFEKDGSFWIVCPNLATKRADGKTIAEWFAYSVRPAAHPIDLTLRRPEGARLLQPCSPDEMADGYGIARSLDAERRFLAMFLPTGFPLDGIRVESCTCRLSESSPQRRAKACMRLWTEPAKPCRCTSR
jgi:hypothetical protein